MLIEGILPSQDVAAVAVEPVLAGQGRQAPSPAVCLKVPGIQATQPVPTFAASNAPPYPALQTENRHFVCKTKDLIFCAFFLILNVESGNYHKLPVRFDNL